LVAEQLVDDSCGLLADGPSLSEALRRERAADK